LPVKEDIVISANVIERVARAASGSAGVSGADSECWKSLLVSHGKASERLREAVVDLATKMSNEVMEWSAISALLARRGLMLDKKPGLRPIGVGEVLQRILAKSVAWVTKGDVTQESGVDNLAGGLKSGIEGGVHAMKELWADEGTEVVVDASNAFGPTGG
ncbi:unnamed protein product, partial [Heterosigma akashiwo]